jgi:hypothetical protein
MGPSCSQRTRQAGSGASRLGGDVQQVTTVDPADPADQHLWPEILPDGRHFLFLRSRRSAGSLNVAETGSAAVYIGSLGGGALKRIVDSPVQARFAPPDRLLFVRDGSLYSQRFDPARLELTGQPELLVNDVHYTLAGTARGIGLAHRRFWFTAPGTREGHPARRYGSTVWANPCRHSHRSRTP